MHGWLPFSHASSLRSVLIPTSDDPRLKKTAKRIRSCRPVAMFKLSKHEFLLCYDGMFLPGWFENGRVRSTSFPEFGLYVDNHGDPSRNDIVEWEGKVERVVRCPPYILLFNNRFIEIRHAKSGSLVQIISGHSIGCIWDDRGMNQSRRIFVGSSIVSQDLRVYGTMDLRAARPDKRGTPATQRVWAGPEGSVGFGWVVGFASPCAVL